MKQVVLRRGIAILENVPAPVAGVGQVLVRAAWSCVSAGTESAGMAGTTLIGLLNKVRRNPDLINKTVGLLRQRGFNAVATAVRDRIETGFPPGYSCAGRVIGVGPGVDGVILGDRVACAGGGYAAHAEVIAVPRNLVVKVPAGLDLSLASTVALGATALHAVHRADVSLGDRIGVIGLGMLGQLTAQLLRAAGGWVFGWDPSETRVTQARALGMDAAPADGDASVVATAHRFTEGRGLDAVIITAATRSDAPLQQAMQMARKKGRVILVGDVGLEVQREEMYAKELDLLVSTSYGPGRYDPSYEEGGRDYPHAYVPWTENRNMRAYLEFVDSGRVQVGPLLEKRYRFEEAEQAYAMIKSETERPYTVLLEYPETDVPPEPGRAVPVTRRASAGPGGLRIGVIGAGSFFRGVLGPTLADLSTLYHVRAVVAAHGTNALSAARRSGAGWAGTDYREVLADREIDAVVIATRHHLHATLIVAALRAGKHVFVEKPLALTESELVEVEQCVRELGARPEGAPVVFVGFNRRYSPYAAKLREICEARLGPLQAFYRVNAEPLPRDHWVHGAEGGGRVVGEACHVFDFLAFLVGFPTVSIHAVALTDDRTALQATDNFTATLQYADGSIGTVLYTAQGARGLAKEYCEIAVDGSSAVLDDYRSLRTLGAKTCGLRTRRPQKGHLEELQAFHNAVRGRGDARVRWDETLEASRIALRVDAAVRGLAPSTHARSETTD